MSFSFLLKILGGGEFDGHTLVKLPLPLFDLRTTSGNTIQAFHIASFVIQVVDCTPRKSRHPKLCFVPRAFEPFRNAGATRLFHQGQIDDFEHIMLIVYSRIFFRRHRASTPRALAKQTLADNIRSLGRRLAQSAEKIRAAVVVVVVVTVVIVVVVVVVVVIVVVVIFKQGWQGPSLLVSGRIAASRPVFGSIPRTRIHHVPKRPILSNRGRSERWWIVGRILTDGYRRQRNGGSRLYVPVPVPVTLVLVGLAATQQAKRFRFASFPVRRRDRSSIALSSGRNRQPGASGVKEGGVGLRQRILLI